jgi:hypothetical protein
MSIFYSSTEAPTPPTNLGTFYTLYTSVLDRFAESGGWDVAKLPADTGCRSDLGHLHEEDI